MQIPITTAETTENIESNINYTSPETNDNAIENKYINNQTYQAYDYGNNNTYQTYENMNKSKKIMVIIKK